VGVDPESGEHAKGLTDKIFASQEPDKLRAVLQALEDAYGPHAVTKKPGKTDATLADLQAKIVKAYTDAVRGDEDHGVLGAVKNESSNIKTRVTEILDSTTGLFPGKLEEIVQAIKLAYGTNALPGTLINNINKAWDTFSGSLPGQI